jgi:hypothetical protein
MLKYYLDILSKTKLQALKEIFKSYLHELKMGNFYYNFEIIQNEKFNPIDTRLKYTIEILKQLSFSSKRAVFVANYQHCDLIVKYWKAMKPEVMPLSDFYPAEDKDLSEAHFVDFIEKLVILDILNNGFINEYFIKHHTFPFKSVNNESWMIAYANVFQLWNHYYKHYADILNNQSISLEKYKEYINEFNKI